MKDKAPVIKYPLTVIVGIIIGVVFIGLIAASLWLGNLIEFIWI